MRPARVVSWLFPCIVAAGLLVGQGSRAETTVPIELQVDLLRKLVRFERGFIARCGAEVRILIVVRSANPASTRSVAELKSAFERAHEIAGKTLHVTTQEFAGVAALRATVVKDHVVLIFFTPGLEADLAAIASGLEGQPIITATTDGEQVARGAVIGFELVSSKPKISLNLGQAKKQGLDFDSNLFRLAKVIQ